MNKNNTLTTTATMLAVQGKSMQVNCIIKRSMELKECCKIKGKTKNRNQKWNVIESKMIENKYNKGEEKKMNALELRGCSTKNVNLTLAPGSNTS